MAVVGSRGSRDSVACYSYSLTVIKFESYFTIMCHHHNKHWWTGHTEEVEIESCVKHPQNVIP